MVAMTLTSAACYAGYKLYKYSKYQVMAKQMLCSLDSQDDDVVDELLYVDDDLWELEGPANHPAVNPAEPLLGNEHALVQQRNQPDQAPIGQDEVPVETVNPTGEPDNNYSRPRNRSRYIKVLLLMVKARFGVPIDSEANRLVIRRYLHDYMTKRRNRPSVIATTIPVVIELSFLPSKDEVDLHICARHPIILERKAYRHAGWWSWFFNRTITARPPAT